jgi:hypothetical protein
MFAGIWVLMFVLLIGAVWMTWQPAARPADTSVTIEHRRSTVADSRPAIGHSNDRANVRHLPTGAVGREELDAEPGERTPVRATSSR